MPESRSDPPIEVFGVDEEIWSEPDRTGGQRPDPQRVGQRREDLRGARSVDPHTEGDSDTDRGLVASPHRDVGAGQAGESDEVRQGAQHDRLDDSAWLGFGRRRSVAVDPVRIPLVGGRTATRSQLAATVAALVVVAFLAGLAVGDGTGSGGRHPGTTQAASTFSFPGGATFESIFPTEPNFSASVAAPNPVPGGAGGPQGAVAAADVYALQLAARYTTQSGKSLERRDAGALAGPWSLVVRRSDGSLGRHSSIATFPVDEPANTGTATRVRVGTIGGYADGADGIVWPIAGKFARIRGDLGRATLALIGGRVSVRRGRLVMSHPPNRFRVVAAEPYRSPVVAESRYGAAILPAGGIHGMVFTDVLRCASFEEALLVDGFGPGGIIGGHPAVASSVGGGNGTLAWEPTPGSIVLVGYSGGPVGLSATAALVNLARSGRLLNHRQWVATHPSVVKQTNAYS